MFALVLFTAAAAFSAVAGAFAQTINVAYAGSMGVVMDRALGPAFAQANNADYRGIGQGSYGLANLLASGQMRSDVFVSVSPGPMKVLIGKGLVKSATPIAGTAVVVAYNPKGRFAADFTAAAAGSKPWYSVLEEPGVRFGRTDPAIDPQGRNIIFAMLLAERYYNVPGLAKTILGDFENPAQIFTEASVLSRLEAGQLDAASAYQSSAFSQGLPFVTLPQQINLSDPSLAAAWYDKAQFALTKSDGTTQTLTSEPLAFYAAALTNAQSPSLAAAFVAFLQSPQAQTMLRDHGYGPPLGDPLH
jgi:molybdate/tungstate transport system substrate-binding protein